jgi:4-aminobutyrate aminotransferase-like enzyme
VRVCKAATGGTGFIVTDYAYHGTTETIAGMSPSTGIETGPGVYTVQVPICTRDAGEFGLRVRRCIGAMRADGIKPAGLLVDTIFSSDGVVAQPEGFLAGAVSAIHDAGGLFIADEVQAGLGRTGHMWGFQRHGIVPDLVTMGKPLGNGHPVAALATRPEVVMAFARRTRYFNTFGGNSVSCAVALAVLDVIEREGLLTNARDTGTYLQKGLEQLATRHRSIAAIRGAGLFIGVDIAANPRTSLDSRGETARIVDGLRREGVLIGTEGRNDDVLKIRPPLPFGRSEADLLLEKLDVVLSEDATTG